MNNKKEKQMITQLRVVCARQSNCNACARERRTAADMIALLVQEKAKLCAFLKPLVDEGCQTPPSQYYCQPCRARQLLSEV